MVRETIKELAIIGMASAFLFVVISDIIELAIGKK